MRVAMPMIVVVVMGMSMAAGGRRAGIVGSRGEIACARHADSFLSALLLSLRADEQLLSSISGSGSAVAPAAPMGCAHGCDVRREEGLRKACRRVRRDRGTGDRGTGDRGTGDRGPGDRGPGDRGPGTGGPGTGGPGTG